MKSSIKALWICSWYPSRVFPLIGNFVKRQAAATFNYTDLAIIHAIGDPSVKNDFDVQISFEPFTTVRIYYRLTKNPIKKAFYILKAYQLGYQQLQQKWGKPDILHIHVLYPAGIFAWFLNLINKLPFVVTEHRGGYIHQGGSYQGFLMKFFTKLTIQRAKAVLAISDYFAKAMQAHGLNNPYYTTIPNVVDTELFIPLSVPKPAKNIFNFLHVSMFDNRIKNISAILKAVAKLSHSRYDFILSIVGDGYDRTLLLNLAQELNILNRFVFFEGIKTHNEVAQIMRKQTDAFILFSNMESQSCVILEAMSCGLPTIATETGGINERITPETGILLDIGDEEGLVEAMNFMIDNHHKYDPSVIRRKIVEKCSIEAVGQSIVAVYQNVLANTSH